MVFSSSPKQERGREIKREASPLLDSPDGWVKGCKRGRKAFIDGFLLGLRSLAVPKLF